MNLESSPFPPLSKAKRKRFVGLSQKKQRDKTGLFRADGRKLLTEALDSRWPIEAVLVREGYALDDPPPVTVPTYSVPPAEFDKLTDQVTPEGVLTILPIPQQEATPALQAPAILLHDVQDPGNLGAVLRIADWFGFARVYTSPNSVDAWNPKAVRAAMGAVFRVPVTVVPDFEAFVGAHATRLWAAYLGAPLLHEVDRAEAVPAYRNSLLLGSEAHGLPDAWRTLPGLQPVQIPGGGGAESLNLSVAAGVLAFWARG